MNKKEMHWYDCTLPLGPTQWKIAFISNAFAGGSFRESENV
jgi:hypothetical protein